jgi:transposase
MYRMDLTEKQWEVIASLIPEAPKRADGRGRPWADNRDLLNGMLWILRTGAQWEDLPRRYGTKSTCHRRFQDWEEAGVFEQILLALAEDLKERGELDLAECFIDGTFVSAKKGGRVWDPRSEAKGARSWQWQTALVLLSPSPRDSIYCEVRHIEFAHLNRDRTVGAEERNRKGRAFG